MSTLLTIQQAANALGVSRRHVQRMIDEAQVSPKTAKWKERRDFIDLSLSTSKHQTIRITPAALANFTPPEPTRTFEEYSEKEQAQALVSRRRSSKTWPKASVFKCAKCEAQAEHYHHEDYSRWWDVEPLCRSCHMQRHADLKKARGQEPLPL